MTIPVTALLRRRYPEALLLLQTYTLHSIIMINMLALLSLVLASLVSATWSDAPTVAMTASNSASTATTSSNAGTYTNPILDGVGADPYCVLALSRSRGTET